MDVEDRMSPRRRLTVCLSLAIGSWMLVAGAAEVALHLAH